MLVATVPRYAAKVYLPFYRNKPIAIYVFFSILLDRLKFEQFDGKLNSSLDGIVPI